MSGSLFDRERLRPVAAPTQAVGLPGRPIETAAPTRRADPVAPQGPRMNATPPPVQAQGAMQLAQALSGFSTTFAGVAAKYFEGVRRDEAQDADAAATEMGMRQEAIRTWADAVRENPALADRSPLYRQIYEERLARSTIQRLGNGLHGAYWNSPLAGSENPGAIHDWLSERLRPVLDSFQSSPAQRAAAAEEVRNQAQGLTRTHQQNASRNLVQRNEDSISSAVSGAFDTFHSRGGASSGNRAVSIPDNMRVIYERVAAEEGVPAALLMAQGQRETGFDPDVISGRRLSNSTAGGRWSDGRTGARGAAQVLPSTARDPGYGVAPLSEADVDNPESAIRFQARYLKARGRALGVTDWNDPAQAARGLAAYGGPGEEARGYSSGILRNAAGFRGQTSGATEGTNFPGLQAELVRIEAEARAQGVDGRRINELMTSALTAAMVRHGREDYAALGMMPRPDGTPGFASTAAGRLAVENARNQILSRNVQQENLAHTRFMRSRAEAGDTLSTSIANDLIGQLERGETPQLSADQLRLAARINPALIGTVTGLANSIRGVRQEDDQTLLAPVELAVNTGQATPQDVFAAFQSGAIRNPSTFRSLLQRSVEQQAPANIFANPLVQKMIAETAEAAAGPLSGGILRDYGLGVAVSNAMREEAATFAATNRGATQGQILQHLRARQAELIQRFNPDANLPAYDRRALPGAAGANAPNPSGGGAGTNAPNPSRRVATAPTATTVEAPTTREPDPAINTQRTLVFGSREELDQAYQAWRADPRDQSNALVRWRALRWTPDFGQVDKLGSP